jgi:hypothetical protein
MKRDPTIAVCMVVSTSDGGKWCDCQDNALPGRRGCGLKIDV